LARSRFSRTDAGFSLIEALVATVLLASSLVALAQLFSVAINANTSARVTTSASVLATQKMEQLRSLSWGYDTLGLPTSDTTSDLARTPETPTGGSGLSPSPPGSLNANTPGFVDYLDAYGRWVGTGSSFAAGTVYIRRWSIEPLPTNPNNTLILQVLVTRIRNRGAADAGRVEQLPDEARIMTVKTRKSL
jgi:type II secretory pathway pseudopilin PulG